MKKLKELGVESDDRRAILSLGYAGEIETDPAYFKSFLDKELKIAAEKNKPATPPDAKDSESLSALLKRMDQERALQMSIRNKSNPPK
jgi:hypothetical protein